jgi:hypothetical protein
VERLIEEGEGKEVEQTRGQTKRERREAISPFRSSLTFSGEAKRPSFRGRRRERDEGRKEGTVHEMLRRQENEKEKNKEIYCDREGLCFAPCSFPFTQCSLFSQAS